MDIEERRFSAIKTLYDLSRRGTLWLVLNTVWENARSWFVSKPTKAGGIGHHAGLALGKKNITGITDIYPMCIGTSLRHGASICVANVFSGSGKKNTYFAIRPFRVRMSDFFSEDGVQQITPMKNKPALTKKELDEFNAALIKHGLHI